MGWMTGSVGRRVGIDTVNHDLTGRSEEQALAARREAVVHALVARARRLAQSTEGALKEGRELTKDELEFLLGLIDVTLEWYDDLEATQVE